MTRRTEQVGSIIRRAVGGALARGLHDERVRGLISVTGVTVTDDLAEATVYVSVMPEERGRLAVAGLRRAAPRLQAHLSRHARLRRVPRLHFRLDESLKRQARLDEALAEAERDGHTEPEQPS